MWALLAFHSLAVGGGVVQFRLCQEQTGTAGKARGRARRQGNPCSLWNGQAWNSLLAHFAERDVDTGTENTDSQTLRNHHWLHSGSQARLSFLCSPSLSASPLLPLLQARLSFPVGVREDRRVSWSELGEVFGTRNKGGARGIVLGVKTLPELAQGGESLPWPQ